MSLTYFTKFENGVEELWTSDGTVAGTHIVKAVGSARIFNLTTVGSQAYFDADDGIHGDELWKSDGTAAGTGLLDDIAPGPGRSLPGNLTNVNGTLFFTAADSPHGFELWKSDGTTTGTVLLKDINPGAFSSSPEFLTNIGGTLFFAADDGVHGVELWKSDGTAAGTIMVADIDPGAGASSPSLLTSVNGTLFFAATDGVHGIELWKTDGTAAGTVMVKDIAPGNEGSLLQDPANVNGTLFLAADDGTNGTELWKSDGTAAGTVMIKDIGPGGFASSPLDLTNVNGMAFFSANDIVHGRELWKSDGTAAGTVLVKDIRLGGANSNIENLINVNGTLFFTATDGAHGQELWKSDGTDAGTVMVADIVPGAGDSSPADLVNVNGVLEFYANDGTMEGLFRSDGTAAGTFEIARGVDAATPIGVADAPIVSVPPRVPVDFNADGKSDILWRNSNGTLADWTMNGGAISSSGFVTSNGTVAAPGASWSVAGISDFSGAGNADVLWRNTDGTLVEWTMSGPTIVSSGTLSMSGVAVKPDASWTVAGVGDFNGDTRNDILWRNSSGELVEWQMNGSAISDSGDIISGGVAARPDAFWSVAGIGDFDGDGRKDLLWRNASGEVVEWQMNGRTIAGSGDVTFSGLAARPDASWSVAGIGDFNHDGKSDLLWRNANGSLAMWLMNGTSIASSGTVTFNGAAVAPDPSWHVVEIGDFNGDSNGDILWRNNNGALAEWLMNGNTIGQSLTPNLNGTVVSLDASWNTQAKPAMG